MKSSLLIISHGSSVKPECYRAVFDCAERLRQRADFTDVAVGFHKQSPSIQEGFEALDGPTVVVPCLAAAGFFAAHFLPRKLGIEEPSFGKVHEVDGRPVVYTEPVGTHPNMMDLAGEMADEFGLDHPSLVVVGHGTPRHPASGQSVRDCVQRRSATGRYRSVVAAFVDEEPFVDDILDGVPRGDVVVVPYFVANGPHVTGDIPRALGIGGDLWDNPHEVGDWRLWYAEAVGLRVEIAEVVRELADGAQCSLHDYGG